VLPDVATEEPFVRELLDHQRLCLAGLATRFEGLPLLQAPHYEEEVTGLERLAELGRALFPDLPPTARHSPLESGLRFSGDAEAPTLELPLPETQADELDLAKVEGELIVTTSRRRRSIPLPRRLAGMELRGARLESGVLTVVFGVEEGTPCG
jgi:arsenite-transporting ATPase